MSSSTSIPFWSTLGFWARLGWVSFGGPGAQIALLQDELVHRRRWISPARFVHALNYCMLLPGPEAQQLVTYMGWLLHGVRGGLMAGLLFVLPGLLVVLGAALLYIQYGSLPGVQAVLYGLKPAVLALVVAASLRLGQRILTGRLWQGIALLALALTLMGVSFVLVVGLAAAIGYGYFLFSRQASLEFGSAGLPVSVQAEPDEIAAELRAEGAETAAHEPYLIDDNTPLPEHAQHSLQRLVWVLIIGLLLGGLVYGALVSLQMGVLSELAAFFTRVSLITFGGAYAVLPYVMDVAGSQKGWVSAAQMMDALALGETTPGPLVLVNTFIGALAAAGHQSLVWLSPVMAGLLGGLVATLFTFLPSFLFILGGAPWVEASRKLPAIAAPLKAISAAVVAVIFDLSLSFGRQVLWPDGLVSFWSSWRSFDVVAGLISALAIVLMVAFRVSLVRTILVSVLLGLFARLIGLVN